MLVIRDQPGGSPESVGLEAEVARGGHIDLCVVDGR